MRIKARRAAPAHSRRHAAIRTPPMTPTLLSAIASPAHWLAVLATVFMVTLAVTTHYEGLQRLNRAMPRWRLPARLRILALIFCIISLHIAEIWMFGIGIHAMVAFPALGEIGGVSSAPLLDAVYLSTTTYTTVGYGDLAPRGPLRLVLGSEALTGFVLLTWSASFTYLEMQRYWRTDA
ncbi:ion channel [Solimonas soli]|uniref:ion channel n=1 Tax=Solimonas soli TaxID=413479 RepID=UPI0004AF2F31|nr:ion channel [Solimonas soli]